METYTYPFKALERRGRGIHDSEEKDSRTAAPRLWSELLANTTHAADVPLIEPMASAAPPRFSAGQLNHGDKTPLPASQGWGDKNYDLVK